MKTTMMQKPMLNLWPLAMVMITSSLLQAQEKPATAINGVKGVKQEAVQSVKKIEPPAVTPPPAAITPPPASITPPPPNNAQTVNKVDGVNTIQGIKAPGAEAPPPPPPAAAANTMEGVNKVEGIKATPPNTVQGVPPPPVGAVSTIRAVQGVQGIIAPKQLNLEAALLIKEDGKGTPAGTGAEGGKGKAAAAALLSGPRGIAPAVPAPDGDGRAGFQEFEKLTAPGS